MKATLNLRWRIAYLFDHLPFACWAELVEYGLGHRRSPLQPIDAVCRADRAANGFCYCGKIGVLPEGDRR